MHTGPVVRWLDGFHEGVQLGVVRTIVCAAESFIGVLIQKPHDVRLARIELKAIDRDFELLSYEAALNLRAPEFCGNARLGPPLGSR